MWLWPFDIGAHGLPQLDREGQTFSAAPNYLTLPSIYHKLMPTCFPGTPALQANKTSVPYAGQCWGVDHLVHQEEGALAEWNARGLMRS